MVLWVAFAVVLGGRHMLALLEGWQVVILDLRHCYPDTAKRRGISVGF